LNRQAVFNFILGWFIEIFIKINLVQENKGKILTLKKKPFFFFFSNDLYYFLHLRCSNIPFASPDNSFYDCPFRHVWLVYFWKWEVEITKMPLTEGKETVLFVSLFTGRLPDTHPSIHS